METRACKAHELQIVSVVMDFIPINWYFWWATDNHVTHFSFLRKPGSYRFGPFMRLTSPSKHSTTTIITTCISSIWLWCNNQVRFRVSDPIISIKAGWLMLFILNTVNKKRYMQNIYLNIDHIEIRRQHHIITPFWRIIFYLRMLYIVWYKQL